MPYTGFIPRGAGMSRNAPVPSLLSTFRKQEKGTGRPLKITEPDDPTAPPLSESSSDDDEATSRRGDIKPSTFGAKSSTDGARKPTVGTRKSTRTAPTKPQNPKRSWNSSDDEISEPEKPVKKAKVAGRKPDGLGSQFTDGALQRKTAGTKATYGAKSRAVYGKSIKLESKRSSDRFESPSPNKSKSSEYKPVDLSDDPLTSPKKEKPEFKRPDLKILEPTPSPKKVFRGPPKANDESTPSPSPEKFRPVPGLDDGLSESSPNKPKANKKSSTRNKDEFMKHALIERKKKKAETQAKEQQQLEMENEFPKVVFKLPDFSQDDSPYDPDLDRPKSPSPEAVKPVYDSLMEEDEPKCPMCRAPVDQQLLDKFSKKKFMTIRQQMRFCTLHKSKTARQTWDDRGYPEIDWNKLDGRIAKHHKFLEDIVKGGASHFGTLFAKSVKSGKNKTLLKSDQNLTPGYYGSRGSRAMEENLINHFADLLRKAAVRDRLVASRGHMAFVQFVLVPELAVRLIMEDMDVPAKKARQIMEESQKIGALLNVEEDDVIEKEDEDRSRRSTSTSSLSSLGDDGFSD